MKTGTVTWFNARKGYGFLKPGDGFNVYVHISAVERAGRMDLKVGQKDENPTAAASMGVISHWRLVEAGQKQPVGA